MYQAIQPGSRQWDIVVLVAREGPITLSEMAQGLGLAKTSTRQQVDRLTAQGWLDRARRHGRPGRPVDVFTLSDQGRRLFAQQADEFARALLEEVAASGGEPKLRSVIAGVGRRLARRLRPQVGEGPPIERVRRLADLLREGAALNDVVRSDRSVTLKIHTCPYHGLVGGRRLICEMEREMVSELVGAETRLNHCMPDGDARCELEVAVDASGSGVRAD